MLNLVGQKIDRKMSKIGRKMKRADLFLENSCSSMDKGD